MQAVLSPDGLYLVALRILKHAVRFAEKKKRSVNDFTHFTASDIKSLKIVPSWTTFEVEIAMPAIARFLQAGVDDTRFFVRRTTATRGVGSRQDQNQLVVHLPTIRQHGESLQSALRMDKETILGGLDVIFMGEHRENYDKLFLNQELNSEEADTKTTLEQMAADLNSVSDGRVSFNPPRAYVKLTFTFMILIYDRCSRSLGEENTPLRGTARFSKPRRWCLMRRTSTLRRAQSRQTRREPSRRRLAFCKRNTG